MECPSCKSGRIILRWEILDFDINLFSCVGCLDCWIIQYNNQVKIFRAPRIFFKEVYNLEYGEVKIGQITVICPVCIADGNLYKISVPNKNITIDVCNTCEACWVLEYLEKPQEKLTARLFVDVLKQEEISSCDLGEKKLIVLCPRCDAQGEVLYYWVPDLEIKLKICNECNACWQINTKITNQTFQNFSVFLKKHGLKYDTTYIEEL